MKLPSRHRIRNSNPGSLRPSTLPWRLPTILSFTSGWGRIFFCFFQAAETGKTNPELCAFKSVYNFCVSQGLVWMLRNSPWESPWQLIAPTVGVTYTTPQPLAPMRILRSKKWTSVMDNYLLIEQLWHIYIHVYQFVLELCWQNDDRVPTWEKNQIMCFLGFQPCVIW